MCALGLIGWRVLDHNADRTEMNRLIALQSTESQVFSYDLVAHLPEPVRRYFTYTINEGTELKTVALIMMRGKFALGSKDEPGYMKITSSQILAVPSSFIWKMSGRRGHVSLSGSDSEQWTRFWLGSFLPVARSGGNSDHERSAFARYVAAAVFWTPAALLPGPYVTWKAVGPDKIEVTVQKQQLTQTVRVELAPEGQPLRIEFERWSNANLKKDYCNQMFGGELSIYREFQGFTLATHVEAGNNYGTMDYFPFFIIDVSKIDFPDPQ